MNYLINLPFETLMLIFAAFTLFMVLVLGYPVYKLVDYIVNLIEEGLS